MDLRIGGMGHLSPLEESSAEVSRDSGVVSQSESSFSMVSEGLSSGTVSQSQSFSAAVSQPEQGDEDDQLVLLQRTAHSYSSYIRATATDEIHSLEKSLEEMLTRVDEFVGMLDMAFVKMVGINVTAMEEQVAQAEGEQGSLPGAFKKIFRTINVPGFLNKPASPRRPQQQHHQELPSVFRTEDYFTSHTDH
ncbi:hypothetical protein JZ751_000317 [Albula glossodonta]|uniref:Biogenesis of lysosome-related organelles complex 1 subunit 4 n=1 Tax=Albula glossodonta TaxID=121402 RepID=A0A8T2PVT1_9TELE|nr:hypothetical protein JZ751_000317 [Albula glossodonta]